VATVIVWDIETGQPVSAKFLFEHEQGRRQPVAGVSPSPDGGPGSSRGVKANVAGARAPG
jgi:hypothetical protein